MVKNSVKLFSVPFSAESVDGILSDIAYAIQNDIYGNYISITNTESAFYATKLPAHADFINKATFSCCDGVGVVLIGKMLGKQIPRIHGPDLMVKCCEYGVNKGWRHFFYGGKQGVPEILSRKLTEKIPGLITAGTYSPPFRPLTEAEDFAIVAMINETKPHFLWVGLGLLKQEKWIAEHLGKVRTSWMSGVGAAFDFHAGTIKRSPRIFQKMGLEWLYRLAFEPRMFVRNVRSAKLFLLAAKEIIKPKGMQ
jgi:N-acetylglucosaminyldiphosphoundecaprenol N-acetyl-beta-D-mannosaminyltransferase